MERFLGRRDAGLGIKIVRRKEFELLGSVNSREWFLQYDFLDPDLRFSFSHWGLPVSLSLLRFPTPSPQPLAHHFP